MSNYYIDSKTVLSFPQAKIAVGNIIYNCIKNLPISAIGGLTHGADPIAEATSIVAHQKGKELHTFFVRKRPKEHGLKKWIEGYCQPRKKIIIVDDVVTTGESTITAIEKAKKEGMRIEKVIVLIDRLEGGREKIEETDCQFKSIFTIDDLQGRYERHNFA